MTNHSFIHLKVHSAYSLSEGAIPVGQMVGFAKDNGMPAIALTDTSNLFGAMEFSQYACKSGIQPIVGCKMWVKRPMARENPYGPKRTAIFDELTLLASKEEGYQNLMKLVSRAYLEQSTGELIHTTFDDLEHLQGGLIALCGLQGAPGTLYCDPAAAEAYLEKVERIFANNTYVDISRLGYEGEHLKEDVLVDIAFRKGLPLVGTNEAYFLTAEQYEAHDALLCIANGTYVNQEERRRVSPHHRLKTPQEMEGIFADLPEAIANTRAIAQRCSFILEPKKPALPRFPAQKPENEELEDQARQGLEARLQGQIFQDHQSDWEKKEISKTYHDRLDFELGVINKMGYGGYYLIVADFIKWAKAHNIPVGPGRGSGAGSLVAWSLTITDVDPIALNLLFERFLNPERVSMPDFDIDFCQDRRDEVIAYVCQKYGQDHVAQIITFGKLQARAALRDVGRVLGMPYNKVDGICKLIPNNPANPVTLKDAVAQEVELQTAIGSDSSVERLFAVAQQIEGLYRHASTHAAGVVIGQEPLENIVALYHDGESPLPATQFNMKYVELTGLVKFDFLGLRTLTVMQGVVDLLKSRGIELDLSKIPLDDEKTFQMLCRVETTGVFQIESAGMREVLRKLQPTRFEEIVALVALYRPGPMDDIPRYLACKHGLEKITYTHPMMENILNETFGVMVYQEQVMQIAQQLAGYSLGQADLLRRAMGKKIKSEMDAQQEIFIKGCVTHNQIPEKTAGLIFEQMAKFASYGFNKCHSAPYGLISYQTAYLRANYYPEFLAALMTSDMQNVDKLNIAKEDAARMGFAILPPDINHSMPTFSVEDQPDETKAIRYGLAALKNVGVGAMEALVKEREAHGPYQSLEDFINRVDSKCINKRLLENLIGAGAFDGLNPQRHSLYASIDLLTRYGAEVKKSKGAAQTSLFAGEGDDQGYHKIVLNQSLPWTSLERAQYEFDAVGFYLSEHPLDRYGQVLAEKNFLRYGDLIQQPLDKKGKSVELAGVVLAKKERVSKNGNKFAFVQFSDSSGVFEGVVFSDVFHKSRALIEPGTIVHIHAVAKQEDDMVRMMIQNISPLDAALVSNKRTNLALTLKGEESLKHLETLFKLAEPGGTGIELIYPINDGQGAKHHVRIMLPQKFKMTTNLMESFELIPGIHVETKTAEA